MERAFHFHPQLPACFYLSARHNGLQWDAITPGVRRWVERE
jgi:hypothetical protein